ncbi:D-lactate dehydrogenase [Balamuthia mandrillaris]
MSRFTANQRGGLVSSLLQPNLRYSRGGTRVGTMLCRHARSLTIYPSPAHSSTPPDPSSLPPNHSKLHNSHSKTASGSGSSSKYLHSPSNAPLPPHYVRFRNELLRYLPASRVIQDPLRTLAYGTDASFYRLIPKLVVNVAGPEEIVRLLRLARQHNIPLTFRAAGTSLSGQAVTDSVLVRLIPSKWSSWDVLNKEGSLISLQPGIIGGDANRILAAYGKKIGPDPSSINSCMIGGITANNSSGMCCGTAQNSYQTIQELIITMSDGTVLDTSSETSRRSFHHSHAHILEGLTTIARRIRANTPLAALIREKYSIKNTTGYTLNAFIDFECPFEILKHLIIGSEGTLAFINQVVLRTVDDLPYKASSLLYFPNIRTACEAVTMLKQAPVDAVELLDRASLRSAENSGLIPTNLGPEVTALLLETRARNKDELHRRMTEVESILQPLSTHSESLGFSTDAKRNTQLWDIRKGLITTAGALRPVSTSVLLEDIAVPVSKLPDATIELQDLFQRLGYHDAVIFGHARDGNLHLLFAQSFNTEEEVLRYKHMMDELCFIVAKKYNGSLKAEHGTGRNVAPFVEMEWGSEAYNIMWEIKRLFDPDNILNPGVILNKDPEVHMKNLKPMPAAHTLVDQCIECGFCERNCPSRELTLTPRQRIVAWREMERLKAKIREAPAIEDKQRLESFEATFRYQGDSTCAADGMCSTSCPVKINTGELIKLHRDSNRTLRQNQMADWVADHFDTVTTTARRLLSVVDATHRVVGPAPIQAISKLTNRLSGRMLPEWNTHVPRPAPPIPKSCLLPQHPTATTATAEKLKVVYFPCCANRVMGLKRGDDERQSLFEKTIQVLEKANCQVIVPPTVEGMCCGMAFASKGFPTQSHRKTRQWEQEMFQASNQGEYPILCDMSPCAHHLKTHRSKQKDYPQLNLYEPIEFTERYLLPRLKLKPPKAGSTLAIHTPCSSKRMGLEDKFQKLAASMAERVIDSQIPCCGMAGDRGLEYSELPASALNRLRRHIQRSSAEGGRGCTEGYSNSRTCEIGLSQHSGVPFRSIFYLVDECTEPLPAASSH